MSFVGKLAFGPYENFDEAKADFKRMMKKDNFRSKEAKIIVKRRYWAYINGYMVEQFSELPDGPHTTFWGVRLDPTPEERRGGVIFLYLPGVGDKEKEIIENGKHHK